MGRGGRRVRRIWLALAAAAAGTALLAAAAVGLARRRETDLADGAAAVTAVSRAGDEEAGAPVLAFREAAAELGISFVHGPGPRGRTLPEDTGSGLAWGDYDGDGDFDLYLVNFAGPLGAPAQPAAANRLYRNDGSLFVDVTARAAVGDPSGFGMGATFADYDGDGDADLHVTNYGQDRLFRNRGDGSFREVAAAAGMSEEDWTVGAAWGDFDRDGRLDLYVTGYVAFDPAVAGDGGGDPLWAQVPATLNPNAFDPVPNHLYHQLPGGRFEEVALPLGAADPGGRGLAATFTDLDQDGWLDLYVANDVSPNALLRNLGGELGEALFSDEGAATGTADPRGSMGIGVTDLAGPDGSGDGLPDLFLTQWLAQENILYEAVRTPAGRVEYRDRVRRWGLGEISLDKVGWGEAFVDLDRDGRVDLAVANGSTLEERGVSPPRLVPQPLFLLWNAGERFVDRAAAAGGAAARPHSARGLAAADFDADGDPDLAVAVNRGRPLLLVNETPASGAWLAVRLEGRPAAAAGARLEVVASGRRQVRFWGADVSFASCHAAEMLFGLGFSPGPVRLELRLAEGRRIAWERPPAGRRLILPLAALLARRGAGG